MSTYYTGTHMGKLHCTCTRMPWTFITFTTDAPPGSHGCILQISDGDFKWYDNYETALSVANNAYDNGLDGWLPWKHVVLNGIEDHEVKF
jgi:hypothetical protein